MPCPPRFKPPAGSSWRRGAITCCPSKTISPHFGPISKRKYPLPQRLFPPDEPTATQACPNEINKGRAENRVLHTALVSAEDVGFPTSAPPARLLRRPPGRARDEEP